MAKKFIKTLSVNTDRYNKIQHELETFNTRSVPLLKYLGIFNPTLPPTHYYTAFSDSFGHTSNHKVYRAVVTAAHVKAANYPGTVIDMEDEINKMWEYVNENFSLYISGRDLNETVCHWDEASGKYVYNEGCIQLTEDWYLETKEEQEVFDALVQLENILNKVDLHKYVNWFYVNDYVTKYRYVVDVSRFATGMTPAVFEAIMKDTQNRKDTLNSKE